MNLKVKRNRIGSNFKIRQTFRPAPGIILPDLWNPQPQDKFLTSHKFCLLCVHMEKKHKSIFTTNLIVIKTD